MKKYFVVFSVIAFLIIQSACSSSIETINLGPAERLSVSKKYYENEDYLEAIKEFEAILLQYPASDVSDDAVYYLGMSRFERGEYILGAYELVN